MRLSLWETVLVATVLGLIAGCGEKPAGPAAATATGGAAVAEPLPAGLFVKTAPPDAKDVLAVKQALKEGDIVVVQGRVGGSRQPFVEGRAVFTIADLNLPTCADNPADDCKTPWDYCCEPGDQKMLNTLTVQVVGPGGEVVRAGLRGEHGLAPMAKVVVSGRISKKQDNKVMVIDAREIHVLQ